MERAQSACYASLDVAKLKMWKDVIQPAETHTENRFQMLETLAMFSNVQPQLQPHLPRAILVASPHQTAPGTPRRTYRAWFGDNGETLWGMH